MHTSGCVALSFTDWSVHHKNSQVEVSRGFDKAKDIPTIPVFKSYEALGGAVQIESG